MTEQIRERITTKCPACGVMSLFIAKDGSIVCGYPACRPPSLEWFMADLVAKLQASEQARATLRAALEGTVLAMDHMEWVDYPGTSDAFDKAQAALAADRHHCPRCHGTWWICEEHPDRHWPHDDCAGPGEPCPVCNTEEPPRTPPGFTSLVK